MNTSERPTGNLAVFIDYENFSKDDFDVETLMQKLKERGRLLVKRAYADWGRFGAIKQDMLRAAVDLVELPSHAHGKNRADMRLAVDAMEIAMTRDYLDTIVVVSGDSDFLPLVSKLRELNRFVIVVARKCSASSLLAGSCDELIYYSTLIGSEPVSAGDLEAARRLLVRALRKLEDEGIEARTSLVKRCLRQLDSSFSEANYGFSQFKQFLQHFVREKTVRIYPLEHGESRIEYCVNGTKESASNPVAHPDKDGGPVDDILDRSCTISNRLLDHIWWAAQLKRSTDDGTINLSSIGTAVSKLFPGFSLSAYGFPKTGGFLKLAQAMEANDLCELQHVKESNQYRVTFARFFQQRTVSIPEPSTFFEMKSRLEGGFLSSVPTIADRPLVS